MSNAEPKPAIKGYEVVRAVYCISPDQRSDLLSVKTNRFNEDGSITPEMKFVENYKRHFYLTKPNFRNYEEKKEWEPLSRLDRYSTTQVDLAYNISRAMGKGGGGRLDYRALADSPYLYGSDIGTPSLIKHQFREKYPECKALKRTVATLDIEATPDARKEVLMVTVYYDRKPYLWVSKEWLGSTWTPDVADRIKTIYHKRLDHLLKYNEELEVHIVPDAVHCVTASIAKLHELKPDFVSIWNMDYDVPTMIDELDRAGLNVGQIMSDPLVPEKYRFYKYIKGKSVKVKAGKERTIAPADRWHKPIHPASFFFVDSMGVYRTIRLAAGMEPNYTLDGVLKRNLGYGKLTIPECAHLDGVKWHIQMQAHHKLDYCAYCPWDGISLYYLEEKIQDLQVTFPILCDISEYENFKSNPTKIIDDMHFHCIAHGHVIGSKPRQVEHELDKYVINLEDHIRILPAHGMENNGYKCIAEDPTMPTRIFIQNGDIDIETTYPAIEDKMNLSKGSTYGELVAISGMSTDERKLYGVNLIAGDTNAIETCTRGFDLPKPDDWVAMYLQEKSQCMKN